MRQPNKIPLFWVQRAGEAGTADQKWQEDCIPFGHVQAWSPNVPITVACGGNFHWKRIRRECRDRKDRDDLWAGNLFQLVANASRGRRLAT